MPTTEDIPDDDALAELLADRLIDRLSHDPGDDHLRHRLLIAAGLPSTPPPPFLSHDRLATRLSLSPTHIRRIESRALLRLRTALQTSPDR